jgi:hypothetical protein
MKPTVKVLALLTLSLLVQACSRKIDFQNSAVVPAARGNVKLSTDRNKNYVIDVSIQNLAEVERLSPARKVYIVWMVSDKSATKNIGQINSGTGRLNRKLNASFEAVSSFKPSEVFITAEDDATVSIPGSQMIITTGKF